MINSKSRLLFSRHILFLTVFRILDSFIVIFAALTTATPERRKELPLHINKIHNVFVQRPRFIKKAASISKSWFGKSSKVVLVDKKSLPKVVSETDEALVMFYAPWCGHCKKFKPEFSKAADILAKKTSNIKLGAFDGSNNRDFNSKYDVKGFPTMVHFRNGKYISHYKGQRTADAVVSYLTNGEEIIPQEKKIKADEFDEISSNRPPDVELLTPDNFQTYLNENQNVLVMFYAPWCGTCKSVKTAFFDAAEDIDEDLDDSSMAIFNGYAHRSFADRFEIKGYPTIWYFSGGEKKYKYHGKFNKEAFVEFMTNPRQMEDIRAKENMKAAQWVGEKDNVEHLSRENFDETLQKHKKAMVYFYINACQHCLNTIKPRYVEAAEILGDEEPETLLAAVNGDWEKPLTKKYDVTGYPTFLYFESGKLKYKYEGSNQAASIVKFLKNPSKELATRQKPKSWQDFTGVDFGRVEHLSNTTLAAFLDKYDSSVIMLHSLWYPKTCVPAREELRKASTRIPKYIGVAAVDCHRQPEQGVICYNHSVKKFPSFKFFKKGKYDKDLEVDNADLLVEYLMSETRSKKDEL